MFENIPQKLSVYVRDHLHQFNRKGDRNQLYLAAAGGVIHNYLGMNVFDENADEFWGGKRLNAKYIHWFGHPLRVILVGQTLFSLRSCRGFVQICTRWKTRQLRATLFEMLSANLFARAGFDIEVFPAEGQKRRGEDFDFMALRDGQQINAEVTAFEAPTFRPRRY